MLQLVSFNIINLSVYLKKLNKQLKSKLLLLVLLCLSINTQLVAQIQPNTFAIIQDHQDFIWTAGHNGLTRHDDNKNITFSSRNFDWPLPFDWIHSISSLRNNNLLLATENNALWKFDTTTGKSTSVNVNIHRQSITHAVEYKSAYFLNVPNKFYRFDLISNQTTVIADNIAIKDLKVTKGNLYLSTNSGLFKLVDNKLVKVIPNNITAMAVTDDTVIVASKNQLFFINDNGKQSQINIHNTIYAIATENTENNIFTVSSGGQIKKYSISSSSELPHPYPNSHPVYTRAMIQDRSKVLWLLTNQGVIKLSPTFIKNHKKIFDVTINGIALANLNNELFVGSYGKGLSKKINETYISFDKINNKLTPKARIITDMLAYENNLYLATFDGLWRYSATENKVNRVKFLENNKLLLNISIKNDRLYLASNEHGSYIYDLKSNKLTKHIRNENIESEESIDVLALNNGNIWIAKTTGVEIYNTFTDHTTKLKVPSQNKVLSLLEYENKVFVATKGDGIYIYDQQTNLLSHIAEAISFTYITLIEDTIWATAEPGLYKINPHNYQLTLEPNTEQFTFTSVPITLNNKVYIGHYGGILELPLLKSNKFNAKVYISKTQVSGKNILLNESINIQSKNDVITLDITSLDYRRGQSKQYKYQINNGLWHQVNGNTLTLTGLSSGQYNIEIMATNSLGQWSNNKAYAQINVAYPWYWTPQIRVLYIAVIISIIAITYWLLYLRSQSISHIHQLLKSDLKNRGQTALNVSRNLKLAVELMTEDPTKAKNIIQQGIEQLSQNETNDAPDNLCGKSLLITLPFFCEYIHKKYHVNLNNYIEITEDNLSYEMQADLYKIIYEAITSAILNGSGRNFKISMQEFKGKLWLSISDDSHSFAHYKNKINFDIAMYYIRQIAAKYNASVNTFNEKDKGSQLVISMSIIQNKLNRAS